MTRRLLRLLLLLAPRDFRDRHGEEVVEVHAARMERSDAGLVARVWFALREVAGVVRLVAGLRLGTGRRTAYEPTTTGGGPMGEGTGGRRTARAVGALDTAARETRLAARSLRRAPGFTAAAITVLALGIGAATAIFSAASAFFFQPLPFAEPDRLVRLYETNPEFGWTEADAAPANMLDWRERVESFADVAAWSGFRGELPFVRDGEARLLDYTAVTGNFFDVLGVAPALGRGFRWDETWSPDDRVVVLAHGTWTTEFGADPSIVGRTIELGSTTVEVVGVAPPGFRFPLEVDLWTPYGWDPAAETQVWFRRAHFVQPVARLAPGVDIETARAELGTVVSALQEEFPETNAVMGADFTPLRDFLVRDVRQTFLILGGASALLLLIACANVANLLLVRASDRAREVGLKRALGAGRGRIALQMVAESLLLAGAGGAVGLALGWIAVRTFAERTAVGIEGATALALDLRVVVFAVVVSGATGLLFGLVPALRSAGRDVAGTLREGGRGRSAGRSGLRLTNVLVAAEVALALLLVVGAGLMVRSALALRAVDPGFEAEGVLAVEFGIPSARYPDRDGVLAFQSELVRLLEARPGIETVGTVQTLPLAGPSWSSQFQAEGWPPDRVGFEILHRRADRGYFEALDIPLVEGRLFGPDHGPDTPPVVVVNETFAREHFPDGSPVGQRIAFDRDAASAPEEHTWYEVVGVVGDQRQSSPREPTRAEVFEYGRQDWSRSSWYVVETTGQDPMAALPAVRSVLEEVDPLVPLAEVRTLRSVWRASMAREEVLLTLLGAFGIMALLLSAVGIWGVTAQSARKRTREIGVRMALGAEAGQVVGLMVRQGGLVVLLGLAVGTAGALAGTRAMDAFLYGVEPTDPATLVAVAALLGGVALLATWLPARRATTVDPVDSLRAE